MKKNQIKLVLPVSSSLSIQKAYGMDLENFLIFGGYPGSYQFLLDREARVKSPALFKQCFDLVCSYPAQEISYNKLLGQLQDKGNTDLIKQILKFTNKKVLTRSSSPKILPGCPALYSVGLDA